MPEASEYNCREHFYAFSKYHNPYLDSVANRAVTAAKGNRR